MTRASDHGTLVAMRAANQRPISNGGGGTTLEILIALTLIGSAVFTIALLRGRGKPANEERDDRKR